ncbi:MAG: hypothetical protein KUG75_13740 [Pseudomonadales bacterium]|nr:hypothetical protein [Pseudomonadales bacterium]
MNNINQSDWQEISLLSDDISEALFSLPALSDDSISEVDSLLEFLSSINGLVEKRQKLVENYCLLAFGDVTHSDGYTLDNTQKIREMQIADSILIRKLQIYQSQLLGKLKRVLASKKARDLYIKL